MSLAEGIHQLLQGGRALDLEENFVVVIGDLDVQMLSLRGALRLLLRTGASVLRHLGFVKVRA